jgi:hypothetical protein
MLNLFRRHVAASPEKRARDGIGRALEDARDAEIDHLGADGAVHARDQHVVRFEVAMHHAQAVPLFDRQQHAAEDVADFCQRHHAAPLLQVLRQARPVHDLHHDREQVLVLDEIEDFYDVGMRIRAQYPGFAREAATNAGVAG